MIEGHFMLAELEHAPKIGACAAVFTALRFGEPESRSSALQQLFEPSPRALP
jgi:hypothetical protein